jgi:hypothetical protein
MMFELTEPTNARLLDVVVLSQKNRQPDENPGAKLLLEIALPNEALAEFDGSLKAFLFTRHATQTGKQAALELNDLPNLSSIGEHVGVMQWREEHAGYSLTFVLGIATERSNLQIDACALSSWRFTPQEGGTVLVRFCAESADVSEAAFGRLAKLKSRAVEVLLRAPEVSQQGLDV